jgi:hypothetical protein
MKRVILGTLATAILSSTAYAAKANGATSPGLPGGSNLSP